MKRTRYRPPSTYLRERSHLGDGGQLLAHEAQRELPLHEPLHQLGLLLLGHGLLVGGEKKDGRVGCRVRVSGGVL